MVAQHKVSDIEGYISLLELAQRLGMKTSGGLRVHIMNGRLKARKFGRDWFVTDEEAERFAKEHTSKPGPRPKPSAQE